MIQINVKIIDKIFSQKAIYPSFLLNILYAFTTIISMKRVIIFMITAIFSLAMSACRENSDITGAGDTLKTAMGGVTETALSEELLSGVWVDENGFVCKYNDGIFSDSNGNRADNCELNGNILSGDGYTEKTSWIITAYENGVIAVDGVAAVRTDSDSGEDYSAKISQKIQGRWISADIIYDTVIYVITEEHMIIESATYGDDSNSIEYKFTDASIRIIYEKFEETSDIDTDLLMMYVRVDGDTLKMISPVTSHVTALYRENSETAELALKEASDASLRLLGEWIKITNAETEEWSFYENGKAVINGREYDYTAVINGYADILLTLGDIEYQLTYSGSAGGVFDIDGGKLYEAGSSEAKKALRMMEIEKSASKLLDAYPDNDNWLYRENCGDIPLLADPEYIGESVKQGMFAIGTPEQLASYCYYANTQLESLPAVFTADIDLDGYEWSSMGWQNPFNTYIFGEGYTISNLVINSENDSAGFLGWSVGARVVDLNIMNASVTGSHHAGIMNGQAIMSSFENCHVQGEVNAGGGGSFLGHSTSTLKNCTADVIVNGMQFEFLTYNEKAKSEIVIDEPVVITIDEETTVYRPEVSAYTNLGWLVLCDGEEVLHRNAETEYSYTYYGHNSGKYEICLVAYISGQYVPISNTVSYTISESGELAVADAVPVRFVPIAESPDYLNHVIDNPHTITIDENNTVVRPDLSGYDYGNVTWVVCRDGKEIMSGGPAGELSFTYRNTVPGFYEIYIDAYIGKGYVPISNIVSYTITG